MAPIGPNQADSDIEFGIESYRTIFDVWCGDPIFNV
jgi:hypothetical protein